MEIRRLSIAAAEVCSAATSGVPPASKVESVRTNCATCAFSQISPKTGMRGFRRSMARAPRSDRVQRKIASSRQRQARNENRGNSCATAVATESKMRVGVGSGTPSSLYRLGELRHGVGDDVGDHQNAATATSTAG